MLNESLIFGFVGLIVLMFLIAFAPLWQGALVWLLSSWRGLWR